MPIKLAKTNKIYLGLYLRDFILRGGGGELFFFYCFLVLCIVHEFYFFKESVHDGGIKRRVGCD